MRPLAVFIFAVLLGASVHASVCSSASEQSSGNISAASRWTLDHYVYDPSLRRDWEVMIDCSHRTAPAQMRLAPGAHLNARFQSSVVSASQWKALPEIKSGVAVEVYGGVGARASILLSGVAVESASLGHPIRVRLNATRAVMRAVVRGPHAVELAAVTRPSWGKP